MIPIKIKALFDFIDFLDSNKENYISNYIPLIKELEILAKERKEQQPKYNYIKKLKYDSIHKEINEKFPPIMENIFKPITEKLKELDIWDGYNEYSIFNKSRSPFLEFKEKFEKEDVYIVMNYKEKYISFRKETHKDFLCLTFVFGSLDIIFKELFDFFKDTKDNEFETFETKEIKVNSVGEMVKKESEKIYNKESNINNIPNNNVSNIFIKKLEVNIGDKTINNISNDDGNINIGENNKIN